MKKLSFFKGLTTNIIILGFVSMLTDLGSQMIFPLIPLFVTGILAAPAYIVGLIEGSAEAATSLLKVFSGYLSDKTHKRKPFIFLGYSISSLVKPFFALANTWPLVLFIRIIERTGKGMREAPRDAIVAESCAKEVRGKAFGFQRAMDGTGSVIGAILALILLPILGYKKMFVATIIPGIIAVITILLVKEKKQEKAAIKEQKKLNFKTSFKNLPKKLKYFILISAIFTLGNYGYAFLLLKAKDLGLTDVKAIMLYTIFYLTFAIWNIPIGTLSDKIGRKPILMGGYAIFAATSLGLMITSGITGLVICAIGYGIFFSMLDAGQRAFTVDLAKPELKATALGSFHTAVGLMELPAGFIAGILWETFSPAATFGWGFALSIIAIILFSLVHTRKGKTK